MYELCVRRLQRRNQKQLINNSEFLIRIESGVRC